MHCLGNSLALLTRALATERARLGRILAAWVVGVSVLVLGVSARAQDGGRRPREILIESPNLGPISGSFDSNLGPAPGAPQPSSFNVQPPGIIGGRQRGAGRLPRPSVKPSAAAGASDRTALSSATPKTLAPSPAPASTGRYPNAVPLSAVVSDAGSANGLTLDAAIAQMMATNLDLGALRYELPQAEADVLTAGLRANPILYMDTQFIPYGSFSSKRPGGPGQYDINITHPLDLSHKRKARLNVARSAQRVIEAQYQDVVRRQIGNLYRAYVDLQAARMNHRSAMAAVRAQERLVDAAIQKLGRTTVAADALRRSVQLDKARVALDDATDSLGDAREAIGLLLNLPPEQVDVLEPQGALEDRSQLPPPIEELTRVALTERGDLNAARLGLTRARAEVRLARANRLDDVFLFYDPITYQDNRPFHALSATSWDVGLAIPLPIYNRNQGNIARANSNVSQTEAELAGLERRVLSEVRQANREYLSSRRALDRLEQSVVPQARAARARADSEFASGKMKLADYVDHLDDEGDTARLYRDALVRHRRSMLDLNTAIGLRLLP